MTHLIPAGQPDAVSRMQTSLSSLGLYSGLQAVAHDAEQCTLMAEQCRATEAPEGTAGVADHQEALAAQRSGFNRQRKRLRSGLAVLQRDATADRVRPGDAW